jgi:hypothetical protein
LKANLYGRSSVSPLPLKVLQVLEIHPIMNSAVEDVFAFKTCCSIRVWDQNLEIHVKNVGDRAVVVPSYMDLEGEQGTTRIHTLMPSGEYRIEPGEIKAFYCYMDETLWNQSRRLIFHDDEGNIYPVEIPR